MPSAFVSKLAREGARDPEALAAWIGRKKHGKALGKLAKAGREKKAAADAKKDTGTSAAESPEVRKARAQVDAAQQRATAARERADRVNQTASDAYGRFAGGQPILSGHHSERSALRDRARADAQARRAIAATEKANRAEADARKAQADAQGAEMRAGRSRPWNKDDFQPGDTVQLDRAGRPGESYRVVRANAKSVTVSRGFAGMDNKNIPYDKVLSRTRGGQTTSDPEAGTPAADTPPKGDQAKAEARDAAAEQRQRQAEAADRTQAEQMNRALANIRGLTRGARGQGSFQPDEREAISVSRLRRMSDEDIQGNLSIIRAVSAVEEVSPVRLSREDRTMLFNVGHDLRRELDRRRSRR